mmetsp:Transcript_18382/g.62549  ORF Transcript_18382/g.62549 Transcript_18382/m.62549 type:complete len:286 (-) Transcript_18382:22-879(-)
MPRAQEAPALPHEARHRHLPVAEGRGRGEGARRADVPGRHRGARHRLRRGLRARAAPRTVRAGGPALARGPPRRRSPRGGGRDAGRRGLRARRAVAVRVGAGDATRHHTGAGGQPQAQGAEPHEARGGGLPGPHGGAAGGGDAAAARRLPQPRVCEVRQAPPVCGRQRHPAQERSPGDIRAGHGLQAVRAAPQPAPRGGPAAALPLGRIQHPDADRARGAEDGGREGCRGVAVRDHQAGGQQPAGRVGGDSRPARGRDELPTGDRGTRGPGRFPGRAGARGRGRG